MSGRQVGELSGLTHRGAIQAMEPLDDLAREITLSFGKDVVSLILYGSLARGEEGRGSDIDVIAVVKDEKDKSTLEEKVESKLPFFNDRFNSLLSLHCFTLNEVRVKKTLPLIKAVMKEGLVLSGKPLEELITE